MSNLAREPQIEYGTPAPPSHSAFLAFEKPIIQGLAFADSMRAYLSKTPTTDYLQAPTQAIEEQLANPEIGGGQQVLNTVAGLAGGILDPASVYAGGLIGKVAGVATRAVTAIAPRAISTLTGNALSVEALKLTLEKQLPGVAANKFAKYLPQNLHEVLEAETRSAGTLAGFTLPENFQQSFDADTGRLDYGGLGKLTALNGGIGLAFPAVGWTAGLILGRAKRGLQEAVGEIVTPAAEEAVTEVKASIDYVREAHTKGIISDKELKWYEDYITKPEAIAEHQTGAHDILTSENHPVNVLTGNVELPFMSQADLKNMQTFAVDSLTSNADRDMSQAMQNFVVHKQLDQMIDVLVKNPGMMDGLLGHIEHVTERLEQRITQLEKEDIRIKQTTPRSATRVEPLKQEKLYRMMREGNMKQEESPFIIPKTVQERINQERVVFKLQQQEREALKEFKKRGNTKYRTRADKIRENINAEFAKLEAMPKLPTQAEELAALTEKFIGKELPDNFRLDHDFYRLLDLAHVSPKARGLLARIEIREQYNQQKAMNEMFKAIHSIADAGIRRTADGNKVVQYLKQRIEKQADAPEFKRDVMDKQVKPVPPDEGKIKTIEDSYKEAIENEHMTSELKQEFNETYTRLKQFKEGEHALTAFVQCMIGAANVVI